MSFDDAVHRGLFIENMASLRSAGFDTNITLVSSEGKSFHCHRFILAAASPFFRAMLTSGIRMLANVTICMVKSAQGSEF